MLRTVDASRGQAILFGDWNLFPSALPAQRLRLAARFFCQGSALRSDERKHRGLDSAGS